MNSIEIVVVRLKSESAQPDQLYMCHQCKKVIFLL